MASPKPTFVVIPGAFHYHTTLDFLLARLNKAGYPTKTATLKSVGSGTADLPDDVALIRDEILLPLFAEGKDAVLVLHSYAGMPGSVAIKALSKRGRQAKGLSGGLIGVIYMCAFVPQEGQSLKGINNDQWTPWQSPDPDTGLLGVPDPKPVFYKDVEEPLASEATAAVQAHSMRSMETPVPVVGYTDEAYDGRRAYIRCLEDQAIPLFAQDMMLKTSDVEWITRDMQMGHSPFLVDPEGLSNLLIELCNILLTAS